jgi:hypothetical protein
MATSFEKRHLPDLAAFHKHAPGHPTQSGNLTDALLLESDAGGITDFLLLESDSGAGTDRLLLQSA